MADQQNQSPSGGRVRINEHASIDSSPLQGPSNQFEGAGSKSHHSSSTVIHTQEYMAATLEQFVDHVDVCGEPLKEEIMKKVIELKSKDQQTLKSVVEELKQNESTELIAMNQVYLEKKFSVKKLSDQNDRLEVLINSWVDNWRRRRRAQRIWQFWKAFCGEKAHENRNANFCDQFYERGLMMRAYRHMKLFSQVAGNRMYERKVKERITTEVKAMVEEKKLQFEFLESMIKELEEKYRIELRKKAILKNQCDQAYLRGASAISQEALKMSYSTLEDYYRGMKMPVYNGQNIYNQMRSLNAETTLTAQIHKDHRAEPEVHFGGGSQQNSARGALKTSTMGTGYKETRFTETKQMEQSFGQQ